MSYYHLSIEERVCTFKYYEMKLSVREIRRLIGRNASTTSRETKCIGYGIGIGHGQKRYHPVNAQPKYDERQKKSHRPLNMTTELKTYIGVLVLLTNFDCASYEDFDEETLEDIAAVKHLFFMGN